MQDIDKVLLKIKIEEKGTGLNLYKFIKDYY